jgi:hypothetical protein
MRYTKTFTVESLSDKPVVIEASLDGSAPAFQPAIEPARFELPPHGRTSVTFTARSSVGMKPLQHDRVQVWFREPGKPESGQVRSFLLAAPAAPSGSRMAKPAMPYQPSVDGAMKRELRMPPGPAVWMGQSDLNRFAQMQEIAFDTFKDRATGEVITGTPHSSGALHRQIVDEIQCLAAAYACTGNKAYAKKVRDWFVLYAEKANDYPLALPLVEASSALCPNNATYVQASVIVGPMMKALFWVWPSDVFSPEDRRLIHRQFILVRAMESMKIHPGMTNMQDEINNMLFFAGLTTGDPNLIAEGLFGDHGVQAKIEKSFAPDGSTEESIAANYHGVVVGLVSTLVDAVLNAGIETDLNFDRLEKARRLLALLTMPDGRIPNRGDSPAPAGSVPDADRLPSLTFDEFGMSVLREGRGSNAVYVALDHRLPPPIATRTSSASSSSAPAMSSDAMKAACTTSMPALRLTCPTGPSARPGDPIHFVTTPSRWIGKDSISAAGTGSISRAIRIPSAPSGRGPTTFSTASASNAISPCGTASWSWSTGCLRRRNTLMISPTIVSGR